MYHMYIWYAQRPEMDNKFPGKGAMDSCELLWGC